MLAELISLVAPPRCALCRSACRPRLALCDPCDAALQRVRPCRLIVPHIEAAWAAASYEGIARDLVVALKFGRRLRLAAVAASVVARHIPREHLRGTIVPVPADPVRRRWRGFDAAEEVAGALAHATGLPLRRCLRRPRGRRQVGRARAERLAYPPKARSISAVPAEATLVDDVTTTGATLSACARALKAGGCARVAAVTFASADWPLAPDRANGVGATGLAA